MTDESATAQLLEAYGCGASNFDLTGAGMKAMIDVLSERRRANASVKNPSLEATTEATASGHAHVQRGAPLAFRGKFLNIGILAHVDAGKTSLTERLLFNAGVIGQLGSVDSGSTQTDSLELERRRGITIQSAVVSFDIGDLRVNIIDTPGHSDFVAEVERALRVLDAGILVVSAVEGIQARTLVLIRTLTRLKLPVVIFVNKIDRAGARYADLVRDMRASLSSSCVPMGVVTNIGTSAAEVVPDLFSAPDSQENLVEVLADHNDALLEAYVERNVELHPSRIAAELASQTRRGLVYPIYFGSALTGAGTAQLAQGIAQVLYAGPTTGKHVRASTFKIERGRAGEKVAYVRVFEGEIRPRDHVAIFRPGPSGEIEEFEGRVSAVRVFERGAKLRDGVATPGSIAKLWGLSSIRIGDQLGSAEGLETSRLFEPPTLETLVRPANPERRPELHAALQRLAERDPFINLQRDAETGATSLQLYGEVQKEIIAATLLEEFGLEAVFEESRTLYVEKPIGVGEALEEIGDGINFFWATVGLRVEPQPPAIGSAFQLEVRVGELPLSFHKAIRESVYQTLQQGPRGWRVIDCAVTVTKTGYASPISAAGDFRNATPLVLAEALKQAGTAVFEPCRRFHLEVPEDTLAEVLRALARLRGSVESQSSRAPRVLIDGVLPSENVHQLSQQLPELARGKGELASEFSGYRPLTGPAPFRAHVGANPYDREQYMLHALGRLSAGPK